MKYSTKQGNWVLKNLKTGELADLEFSVKKRAGGKFMKLWQGSGWGDTINHLQGNTLKVLLHLTDIAGYQNIVPAPKDMAKKLNWKSPNMYRAYNELIKYNLILKQDGIYSINPFYCWRGTEEQFYEARKTLIGGPKQLAERILDDS